MDGDGGGGASAKPLCSGSGLGAGREDSNRFTGSVAMVSSTPASTYQRSNSWVVMEMIGAMTDHNTAQITGTSQTETQCAKKGR
jgi:hypothetical protein